jgi:hypothetical protein
MRTAIELLEEEHSVLLEDIIAGDYKSDLEGAKSFISNWMIEFAKLHVEKALKEASEIVENELEKDFLTKDSILNSYPLENIK